MTKTNRITKAEVKSVPEKQVYSELDFAQSNSTFALSNIHITVIRIFQRKLIHSERVLTAIQKWVLITI